MNAPDTTVVPRAATPVHPTHKFKLLLQREYWEHKGGFLWAPLIAGCISLLLTGMMIVFGRVAARPPVPPPARGTAAAAARVTGTRGGGRGGAAECRGQLAAADRYDDRVRPGRRAPRR